MIPALPKTCGVVQQFRTRRASSVVVYPEAEDVGKPKMFARQSFIVSGEEEEMADTILKARQLGESMVVVKSINFHLSILLIVLYL